MSQAALSNDQHDALQELTNIAMGQAGASLATLLDEFVDLSVPRIRMVAVVDLPQALAEPKPAHDSCAGALGKIRAQPWGTACPRRKMASSPDFYTH